MSRIKTARRGGVPGTPMNESVSPSDVSLHLGPLLRPRSILTGMVAGSTPAPSTYVTMCWPWKKCSVCMERRTIFVFHGSSMKWRECWKCMPPGHIKLAQALIASATGLSK